ncbi:family 78 glycoside hydrolase catalytic domain [candidate division KSB1 bacterium]
MKRVFFLFIAIQMFSSICIAQVRVENPLCENLTNPIGLDVSQPRFSWQITSVERNVMQSAYELRVGHTASALKKKKDLVWATGKVRSDLSVYVPYTGKRLESGKRYYWQVRVWDNKGRVSKWSEPAYWQIGLLNPDDWKAKWIQADCEEDTLLRPSPLLRKQFKTNKKIQSATAYITAHGLYEAHINGKRIYDYYLTPGWTSYNKRLQYQAYDVTELLKKGKNAVGVILGSGWYRGYIGWSHQNNFYGKDISLLFQLDIKYSDGTIESVVSDETWKSSTGPIRSSDIYNGELYDAREEKTGWTTVKYNDKDWFGVNVHNFPKDILIGTYNEPIKKRETIKPINIFITPKGERVIDFGQNLVGWVRVRVSGKTGDKIKLYHAEVLDKEGNFYTENLRAAKQQNIYILKGNSEETFEPHFTFQGFRYVKVEDFPGELKPENFEAVALYSDMKFTGSFTTSNELINQLQHNIQWGQRGNFLDVPTDCPQRDERLGWTGDAQAFFRAASFNMRVHNFFTKWLKDLAADQDTDGGVPCVIPDVLRIHPGGAGWSDAATIVPWGMYLAYGDKRVLEEQYPSMKKWVAYIEKTSNNYLWNSGHQYGDWLYYKPEGGDWGAALTDTYLIAQCFFAYSTQLLINTANVLGKADDVVKYTELLKKVKDAFMKEYMTPNGRSISNTQTAYVLALHFDMLPEFLRAQAAERLVQNIKEYNNHLTTGFLGTPYLCHVLSRFGYTDVAYTLLMQETYPSWLYPVKMGATTIWERWDGIKPDSTFQTPSMNSFNHYAYGAIGDWMYRVAAGIDTYEDGPGYKKIRIKPHIGGGLTHVAADYKTYYGKISSHWKLENKKLVLDVEIPVNTTATVYMPAESADAVLENGNTLSSLKEIEFSGTENGYVILQVGSGKYLFTASR